MNLSGVQDELIQTKKNEKHRMSNGEKNEDSSNGLAKILIMLAPESPLHIREFDDCYDESTYDSFHNFETDVCRDSTDDEKSIDGSSTEEYAMDVVEYEVPSDTENEDFSSASSGTEDIAYVKSIKFLEYHFTDSDDEYILADTGEDSDGSIDPELGPADYWCCLRCRNPSNNPLYSYCERCFQERRELFPPRPKRKRRSLANQRKRSRKMSDKNSSTELESSDYEHDEPAAKKFAITGRSNDSSHSNGKQVYYNSKAKFETADDLTKDLSSDDDEGVAIASVGIVSTSSSSSIELAKVESQSTLSNVKVSSHNDDENLGLKVENKIIQNVYRQERPMHMLKSTDSGVSSCQESSQEFSQLSDGSLARSSSLASTQSFESHTSDFGEIQPPEVSDEQILARAAQFKLKKTEYSSPLNLGSSDVTETQLGLCNFCMSNKKDGVFVHSNSLHLCCCYKCAVKVWKKRKCCPICNQKIKNVNKLFAH